MIKINEENKGIQIPNKSYNIISGKNNENINFNEIINNKKNDNR